jgi:hypothetical protein
MPFRTARFQENRFGLRRLSLGTYFIALALLSCGRAVPAAAPPTVLAPTATPTEAAFTPEPSAIAAEVTAVPALSVASAMPFAIPTIGEEQPTMLLPNTACALIPKRDAEETLGGNAEILPLPPAFKRSRDSDICLLRYTPPEGSADRGWLLTLNVVFAGGGAWYKGAKESEVPGGKFETGSSIGDDYFVDLDNVTIFTLVGDGAFSLTTGELSGNRGPGRTKELRSLAARVVARLRR